MRAGKFYLFTHLYAILETLNHLEIFMSKNALPKTFKRNQLARLIL
jgi:hypothetical protein